MNDALAHGRGRTARGAWLVGLLVGGALAAAVPAVATGDDDPVSRIAGKDRFATAGELAQRVEGDTLWVATGEDFADALAASASGTGPVLLVRRDSAPAATLEAAGELDGIERVRAVGGRAAVGDQPVADVADAAGVDDVQRLGGADRAATASVVADHLYDTAEVAYVASGEDFADALTASAAAGDVGAPLLLATREALPTATAERLDALEVDAAIVVGGDAAVADSVKDELRDHVASVRRVHGPDRSATAAAVSEHRDLDDPDAAYVATGEDFADVLAAAPAATSEQAALLLTQRTSLPDVTSDEVARLGVERARIAGGTAAVDESVADALRWRLLDPEPVAETVAEGFDQPWGLDFLPSGGQLVVTEAPGELSVVEVRSGEVVGIDGVPDVDAGGQGGLLDVAVHPDFPDPEWLYLTYSAPDAAGETSTHLARGRLDLDRERLVDVEVLFAAEPFVDGGSHYGSRVVVGDDGHLFVTVGDRGDKDFDDHVAQDPSNHLGTTVRLAPDGSVPDDNPFVDEAGVADEVFSYGHRNAQGMTVHPETGAVWQSEHGERDGDELNVIEAGGNHGWPEAHTGCEYGSDEPLGDHPEDRDDIVDPVFYWPCPDGGFPPAGMTFYDGQQFPQWRGDLLVGGLATEQLGRFGVDDRDVEWIEALADEQGWRIRDVVVGPRDGALYLAIDADDTPLVRLVNDAGQ